MTIRTFLAAALLAPTLALAAPQSKSTSAQSATTQSPTSGLELGGFIGYETADFSGLALRLDGEMPFRNLGPQVKLSFVGSLGYSYLTWDAFGATFKSNLFKIVPAARFTIPVAPQFDVFGDVGLGIAHASVSVDVPFYGTVSDSSTNLMMRFGAGGWYHVNPKIKLGAMIDLDPIFGDYATSTNGYGSSQTFWSILFGAMFQL
jgi:hypothetical protein